MPTSASTTYTMDELQPFLLDGTARHDAIRLKPSATYRKGDCVYELSATPGTFALYASGNTDGTGGSGAPIPRYLLSRACVTDASGNVSFGTAAVGTEYGQTSPTATAWYKGVFATSDLPASGAGSLDAAGIAILGHAGPKVGLITVLG